MKMYCIFSKEALKAMNGNRGKLAAMAGHAYLHAWWNSESLAAKESGAWMTLSVITDKNYAYRTGGNAKKVCLVVETTEELINLYNNYKDRVGSTLVVDSALTVFEEPTTVCVGIGPILDSEVGEDLKLLKVLI